LRLNRGLRVIWPLEARRRRDRTSWFLRRKRLSEADPLRRRGPKANAGMGSKKSREDELAKERRLQDGWVTRCRHLGQGKGKSSGRRLLGETPIRTIKEFLLYPTICLKGWSQRFA
jgi:hypothetical protein